MKLGKTAPILFSLLLLPAAFSVSAGEDRTAITATPLTDYLTFFYAGREEPDAPPADDWVNGAAMRLGIGTYAIHQGNEALVYDTFTTLEQARWVRAYLQRKGIEKITVVQSHWHLDHVAGNEIYQDRTIISLDLTRDIMLEKKAALEAGEEWGPPPIKPLIVPNVTFSDRLDLYVGDIKVECHRFNIHTHDANLLYIPQDKIMLVGDALEDPITYMVEPEGLRDHLQELQRLRAMDIKVIYPNHGDPLTIVKGGYDKTFIDATVMYISGMLKRVHDQDFRQTKLEDYVGEALASSWIHPWKPYREVHDMNLQVMQTYYVEKNGEAGH